MKIERPFWIHFTHSLHFTPIWGELDLRCRWHLKSEKISKIKYSVIIHQNCIYFFLFWNWNYPIMVWLPPFFSFLLPFCQISQITPYFWALFDFFWPIITGIFRDFWYFLAFFCLIIEYFFVFSDQITPYYWALFDFFDRY